MVVHRKDIDKQNVKNEKFSFSDERRFLHMIILKIVSVASHKKDMKKKKLESCKICFLQKVVLT